MLLFKPRTVPGGTPDYVGGLPPASEEICGTQGVYAAVGNVVSSIVYRGTWDARSQSGNWNFAYHKEGSDNLVQQ